MRLNKIVLGSLAALLFAAASFAAQAGDLSGTWSLTVQTGMGSGNPTIVLEQDGEALSGTYRGQLGESDLTGAVDGNSFEFSFTVEGMGQAMTTTYEGEIDGDEISGAVDMGGLGEGSFTGTRQ